MIQKKAFAIILGKGYRSYDNALKVLQQDNLSTRRLKLCKNFAIKCTNNPKHTDMFKPRINNNTRHKQKYTEPKCSTDRYYKSAVPFLTRLLNKGG